ncbi:hypothetical protein N2152v2_004547 [Parachlorella kessleri]
MDRSGLCQLPAQPGTSPPASATLHHVQTLGLSSSSSCGGGSNARWPGEAGPAGASGTRPGDSQARLAAMQPSADAGASAPAVGAPVEEFDSAPAAAKPSPAPMAFIRAARPCALPRQLAVTNAPATSAMAIPVKRAHPPARPGGSNAGTSHGSVDSSSAGPALSGADGSSGGDSTAGRAGGSARPLPDWQEQRGWRRRNRGDGRKPMQGGALGAAPAAAVTSTAPQWKAEEPWWVRRLAARLTHALQGVDPYRPIPEAVAARVLSIVPEPLTEEIKQQLWPDVYGAGESEAGQATAGYSSGSSGPADLAAVGAAAAAAAAGAGPVNERVGSSRAASAAGGSLATVEQRVGGDPGSAPAAGAVQHGSHDSSLQATAAGERRPLGDVSASGPPHVAAQPPMTGPGLAAARGSSSHAGETLPAAAQAPHAAALQAVQPPEARQPEQPSRAATGGLPLAAAAAARPVVAAAQLPANRIAGNHGSSSSPGATAGQEGGAPEAAVPGDASPGVAAAPRDQEPAEALQEAAAQLGDVFAAELAAIMQHYREVAVPTEAAAAEEPTTGDDTSSSSGGTNAGAAGSQGEQQGAGEDRRKLYLADTIVPSLFRTLASVGGVDMVLALYYILDHSDRPYPTRSRPLIADLMHLASINLGSKAVLSLLAHSRRVGVPPDRTLYFLAMNCCAKCGDSTHTAQLLKDMVAEGLDPEATGYTLLLMSHEKRGDWEAALDVYAMMGRLGVERNSFTYRALISSLTRGGKLETAFDALDWMAEDGVHGNAIVYQTLINACLEADLWDKALSLLPRMRTEGVWFSPDAVSRLTHFCASRGQPRVAFNLFKEVRQLGLLLPPKGKHKARPRPTSSSSFGGSSPQPREQQRPQEQQGSSRGSRAAVPAAARSAAAAPGLLLPEGSELGSAAGGAPTSPKDDTDAWGEATAAVGSVPLAAKQQAGAVSGAFGAGGDYPGEVDGSVLAVDWSKEVGEQQQESEEDEEDEEEEGGGQEEGWEAGVVDGDTLLTSSDGVRTGGEGSLQLREGEEEEEGEAQEQQQEHERALGFGMEPVEGAVVTGGSAGAGLVGMEAAATVAAGPASTQVLPQGTTTTSSTSGSSGSTSGGSSSSDSKSVAGAAARRRWQPSAGGSQAAVAAPGAAAVYGEMVAACQRAKMVDEMWEIYGWMEEDGVLPDGSTYSRLASTCSSPPCPERALPLYRQMLERRVHVDSFATLHLATALAACEEAPLYWPHLLRMLHRMHLDNTAYKDTHVQTMAIVAAGKLGRLGDALAVYNLMLQDGVRPNAPTFNALMMACLKSDQIEMAFDCHDVQIQMGTQPDVVTFSTLIACCEKLGDVERAEAYWASMQKQGIRPDTICYNSLICCYERVSQPARALALFDAMAAEYASGQEATFADLCSALAKHGKWEQLLSATQMKEWLEAQGRPAGSVTYTEILDMSVRGGLWRKALDLFQGMEGELEFSRSQPNTISYAAAITACARMGDLKRALALKQDLTSRGLSLNAVVYNPLLVACEASGQLDAALELLAEMRERGISQDAYTYSTLISCCKASGNVARAMQLYREMQAAGVRPNIVVCNSVLAVCAAAGDADVALHMYNAMVGPLGCGTDDITYHCTLEATGKAQRWGVALRVLRRAMAAGYRSTTLCLDVSKPDAALLDLHYFSATGAVVVLRAWLLLLKLAALEGRRVEPGTTLGIVTGWGRRSKDNVATLKPAIARVLREGLGPPMPCQEPQQNPGMMTIEDYKLYPWLLEQADLGLSPHEEEAIYKEFMQGREAAGAQLGSAAPLDAEAAGGAPVGSSIG